MSLHAIKSRINQAESGSSSDEDDNSGLVNVSLHGPTSEGRSTAESQDASSADLREESRGLLGDDRQNYLTKSSQANVIQNPYTGRRPNSDGDNHPERGLQGEEEQKEKPPEQVLQGKTSLDNLSFMSRLLFNWVDPVIEFTRRRNKLAVHHLGELRDEDKVKPQIDKLRAEWARRGAITEYSLVRAILRAFKREFLEMMGLNAVQTCFQMSIPFVMKPLVAYIKTGENAWDISYFDTEGTWLESLTPARQYGLTLTFLFVFLQSATYLIQEYVAFGQSMVGAKTTNALVALVYEKQFRLSAATNKHFKQGELVTFVQVDAEKMMQISYQLPIIAALPIMFTIGFGLLFYYLGWSFVVGLMIMTIFMFLTSTLSRYNAMFQKGYMKCQDERVNITTEALNNIKIIKLYSWIRTFASLISQKRRKELGIQRKKIFVLISILGSNNFFPIFIQVACLATYVAVGNSLDLPKAYTVITIFSLINFPMRMLPMFIGQFIEFLVSMKRIQKFLLCDETNPALLAEDQAQPEVAVQFRRGYSYHWGVQPESDHDKKEAHSSMRGARKKKALDQFKKKQDGLKQKLIDDEEAHHTQDLDKQTVGSFVALRELDLSIKKGEFVCVIGNVGSGKSSLLSALIGDLLHAEKAVVDKYSRHNLRMDNEAQTRLYQSSQKRSFQVSPIVKNQAIAYAAQIPWIQNKTIRDNILFGQDYDEARYKDTLNICELLRDLEILPSGDLTEIGEKGINLSGGQKARVALARAVYSDRDLVLMDDPISALDAEVKKKIFENVFLGAMREKTRVLVTHAADFLHLVDRIILFDEGRVVLAGPYEEVKDDPYLIEVMSIHQSHKQQKQELVNSAEEQHMIDDFDRGLVHLINNEDDDINGDELDLKQEIQEVSLLKTGSGQMDDDASSESSDGEQTELPHHLEPSHVVNLTKEEASKEAKGKIISNENEECNQVGWAVYKQYFLGYYGPFFFLILLAILTLLLISRLLVDYLIGQWANESAELQHSNFFGYFLSISGFILVSSLMVSSRGLTCQLFTLRSTKRVHEEMVDRILHAPINTYFDVTPIGRVLNKFSKDLNAIENQMPWQVGVFFVMVVSLLQTCGLAIYAFRWFIVILPVIFLIASKIVRKVAKAIGETVRLQSTTKSPTLSYLGESFSGCSTIRAFNKEAEFTEGFHRQLNKNILAAQMRSGVAGWFAVRVDCFALFLIAVMATICVLLRDFDHVIMSMLLSYLLTIQVTLTWCLKCFMLVQSTMVNADRCLKMLQIPQERALPPCARDLLHGRPGWPEQGCIAFEGVSLRYRPNTDVVLRDLSFAVGRGEKIGIVGRTGAGKSTICLSITRLVEIFQGSIKIDGIDIQDLSLEQLRARITVIPQDPTLFTGTLRFNLDPDGKASDAEIKRLLEAAQLTSLLHGSQEGLGQEVQEGGQNMSSGERQLICICRAILRQSRLVVLDEATSNIDILTEQKIQQLIQTQFRESTMLTIAHRLNTIIESDRVLVLSFGRVVEFDSPANLMRRPEGEFAQLLKELKKEGKSTN